MNGWPARLYWSGYLALALLGQSRFPFQSAEAIRRAQSGRLRATLRHAAATVPYYRETFRRLGLGPDDFRGADDLAQLPLLERADVQRDPERFLSSAFKASETLFLRTGGSSGQPVPVRHDTASVLQNAAQGERERSILCRYVGRRFGYRELIFGGPRGITSRVQRFGALKALFPAGLRIERRYHSALDAPEAALALFREFRPHLVRGYGSYTARFFAYLESSGEACPMPKAICYGADALPEGARQTIEERFGVPVFSVYQAAEAFKIGFQCERRRAFHLNLDLYPLRLIGPSGEALPTGESGEVVVSNLVNRATVLLNYRLGDRGALAAEPCGCGRTLPLLARLEGRTADALIQVEGRELTLTELEAHFWPLLRQTLLYQVEQPTNREVIWRLVTRAEVDRETLRRSLQQATAAVLGGGIAVRVEFVEDLRRTAEGKVRQVLGPRAAAPAR